MARSISYTAIGVLLLAFFYEGSGFEVWATEDVADSSNLTSQNYAGSQSCRKCHEKFYQLWANSHHGLAMQPFTAELVRNKLTLQEAHVVIGDRKYRLELTSAGGWVVEQGRGSETRYRIDHAMGGKNVYYFLTSTDRGRLQTLPLAYGVNRKEWFYVAAIGVDLFFS